MRNIFRKFFRWIDYARIQQVNMSLLPWKDKFIKKQSGYVIIEEITLNTPSLFRAFSPLQPCEQLSSDLPDSHILDRL